VIEGWQLDLEPGRQSLHQRQRAGNLRELSSPTEKTSGTIGGMEQGKLWNRDLLGV
jgi:hypothetical protein